MQAWRGDKTALVVAYLAWEQKGLAMLKSSCPILSPDLCYLGKVRTPPYTLSAHKSTIERWPYLLDELLLSDQTRHIRGAVVVIRSLFSWGTDCDVVSCPLTVWKRHYWSLPDKRQSLRTFYYQQIYNSAIHEKNHSKHIACLFLGHIFLILLV